MGRNRQSRRDFLKTAAVAGVGLATIPTLLNAIPQVAAKEEENTAGYHFVAVSRTSGTPPDLVALEGDGGVTPSEATGGGVFTHFVPAGLPPFPIKAAGTWKPTRVNNFNLIGTYGTLAAGVLDMQVNLVREIPSRAVIPAHMKVVCNLGPAGLKNDGLDEGVYLDVGGLSFEPFGTGLTVFTQGNKHED
jgi:hypothetical protein